MQVISIARPVHTGGGRVTQVCDTDIEGVIRQRERTSAPSAGKDRRRTEPKHDLLFSLFFCFLRNIIAIEARKSVFNMEFTQKHQRLYAKADFKRK